MEELQNFRITTSYVFEIFNTDTGLFHQVWIEGEEGKAKIALAKEGDTSQEVLDWDFAKDQIPNVPIEFSEFSNDRVNDDNELQLLNVTTEKFHTLYIGGDADKPTLSISQEGEE